MKDLHCFLTIRYLAGRLPAAIVPTANALIRLNNVFDVLNSCSSSNPNPYKRALSRRNERELMALLDEARAWLSRWDGRRWSQNRLREGTPNDHHRHSEYLDDAAGRSTAVPADETPEPRRHRELLRHDLHKQGPNDTPDPTVFRAAYRKSTVSRIVAAPVTANCEADGDHVLNITNNVARRVSQPVPSARVTFVRNPCEIGDVHIDMVAENCRDM